MKEPKKEVMSLFTTPVAVTNIGREFTKDELQLFLKDIPMYKKKVPRREDGRMFNHRSKNFTLFDSHVDTLKDIRNFCERELKSYLEEIAGIDTNFAGLRITQSWLNKNKPGEYHHPHYHANSYLSAVLYIKCLPNDGIVFNNRLEGLLNNIIYPIIKSTEWNANTAKLDVKEGDLIIFPSSTRHYVEENNTDKERISLSFNTFPIGELGTQDSGAYLKL